MKLTVPPLDDIVYETDANWAKLNLQVDHIADEVPVLRSRVDKLLVREKMGHDRFTLHAPKNHNASAPIEARDHNVHRYRHLCSVSSILSRFVHSCEVHVWLE